MVAIATADKEGAAEGSHSLSLASAAGLLNCWKGDSCVGAARARSDWYTRMARLVKGLGGRQLTLPRPVVGACAPALWRWATLEWSLYALGLMLARAGGGVRRWTACASS